MGNSKTREGLIKLIETSLILQNMTAEDIAKDKTMLSLGLQEVAKYIGDAHGMDWAELVTDALRELTDMWHQNDDANDLADAALLKAMGHKPH